MKNLFMLFYIAVIASACCLTSCNKEGSNQPNQVSTATASAATSHDKHTCDNHGGGNNCNGGGNNCGQNGSCGTAPTSTCGTATVTNLVSQNHVVGTVTVSNDATNLYVTYSVDSNCHLQDLHLYVGDTTHTPSNCDGHGPDCTRFQYSSTQCTSCSQYTFTIALSSINASCFIIAAEADVTCSSGSNCNNGSNGGWGGWGNNQFHGGSCGNNCGPTQTAWCCGTPFGGRCCGGGSAYINYCIQSCGGNACILAVNLLFGGEYTWPNNATSVTVGGYTYTTVTIQAVNFEPANDAQAGLWAVATLDLYGNTISPPASVRTAAPIVNSWLATLGQLTSSSTFTAPANVESAIATITTWEVSQYCAQ